jgi:hypothetical protein
MAPMFSIEYIRSHQPFDHRDFARLDREPLWIETRSVLTNADRHGS